MSLTPPEAVRGLFSERYRRNIVDLCSRHVCSGMRGEYLFSGIVTSGEVECSITRDIGVSRSSERSADMKMRRRVMFVDQADGGALAHSVRDYIT